MKTERKQIRRGVRGWRKPEGSVYIVRGTPYGNPFKWLKLPEGKTEAQEKYKEWLPGAIERGEINLEPLRGKVLMCYCKPNDNCHGDIIIEWLQNNS